MRSEKLMIFCEQKQAFVPYGCETKQVDTSTKDYVDEKTGEMKRTITRTQEKECFLKKQVDPTFAGNEPKVINDTYTRKEKRDIEREQSSERRRDNMRISTEDPTKEAQRDLQRLSRGITEEEEDDIETEEEEELEEVNLDGQIYHARDGTWVDPDKESGSKTYPKGRGGQFRRSIGKKQGSSEEKCGRRNRQKVCKDGSVREGRKRRNIRVVVRG